MVLDDAVPEYCDPRFKVGNLNIGDEARAKAGLEPVGQRADGLGRHIGGDYYLLVCIAERVEYVEEFLLRGDLAGDELDIVHDENVKRPVLVPKLFARVRLYGRDDIVGKCFARHIEYLVIGMACVYGVAYGVDEMGFSEPDGAVNVQRIISGSRVVGDCDCACPCKAVGVAHNEVVKCILGKQRRAWLDMACLRCRACDGGGFFLRHKPDLKRRAAGEVQRTLYLGLIDIAQR